MTALITAVILIVTVVSTGLAAGPLVRRAAPALMHTPRLAVATLVGVLAAWLAGFAAFGPMLAWALAAPTGFLPGNTGEVCQRCLAAANPLPADLAINAAIPAVILIALPVVLLIVMVLGGLRYRYQGHQQRAELESVLRLGAYRTRLAGHSVTVIQHDDPTAFALSNRRWGIVVSTALLRLLNTEELGAVVAHEAAHVRQRHHLIIGLVQGVLAPLRWVPLVAAISAAVPHYLEMAADNAARDENGTAVMASALLKIGEKGGPTVAQHAGGAVVLHAAGTDRIRHLVAPPNASRGIGPMAAMMFTTIIVSISSVLVVLPYGQALLDGCLTL